jgi:hypothetical protein
MIRHLFICALSVAAFSASASAGHHHRRIYAFVAPPVVYAAPMVAYQPAYVVPTTTVAVQAYPFSGVSYSTQYYAPMVPVASAYPVVPAYYGPPVGFVAPSPYAVPIFPRPGFYHHHGVWIY